MVWGCPCSRVEIGAGARPSGAPVVGGATDTAAANSCHLHRVVLEAGFHHAHGLHLGVLGRAGRPVREQSLIDLEQGALVVDEKVEDVCLVFACKVADFDSILGELGQSEQALFELFGLF